MRVSKKCIDLVKEFEGLYLTAYQDPVGIWTIGENKHGLLNGVYTVWYN